MPGPEKAGPELTEDRQSSENRKEVSCVGKKLRTHCRRNDSKDDFEDIWNNGPFFHWAGPVISRKTIFQEAVCRTLWTLRKNNVLYWGCPLCRLCIAEGTTVALWYRMSGKNCPTREWFAVLFVFHLPGKNVQRPYPMHRQASDWHNHRCGTDCGKFCP